MKKDEKRVLGRVLAVEETNSVHGAQQQITTIVDIDTQETAPRRDISFPIDEQSIPASDTTAFQDSGTAADTGVALDCSTSRLDISADPDC